MKNENFINEKEVRKAVAQLKPNGQVFEVRVIGQNRLSGYFRDADHLITAFNSVDLRGSNVYITVNNIKQECLSRVQSERFVRVKSDATSDSDVIGYDWLFIDLDPERMSGISSSDSELKKSYALASKVYEFLKGIGFEEPVKAVSGNGSHLLYKIGLENTEENTTLLSNCLQALDMMFSTEEVHIDTVVFNPSRVQKLYGTLAQKGANTSDRPFRMSHIIGEVKEIKQNSKALLEKLSDMIPRNDPIPQAYNNYQPEKFDIESWMTKHGIGYRTKSYKDGTKYVLDVCPFDSSHKAPDSSIFKMANGAIGFKCLHNHCQDKTWHDVRIMYEPDAYQKTEAADRDREIEDGWKRHNANRKIQPMYSQVNTETPEFPMFETASMILDKPQKTREFIRTGIIDIDSKTMGLEKGCVTVVSGLRGAAKSTVLSEIMLNAIEDGQTVICYSGELTDRNFIRWMIQQAAGRSYTEKSEQYENYFTVPNDIQRKIATWMGERFWLYNNDYGNSFTRIVEILKAKSQEHKADLIVIDNLMALDLSELDRMDKYEAQTKFVWALKDLAALSNTHIVFVAHPRKAFGFLRLDDISGSGNIANIVDNAFIVHRNNEDFKRETQKMFRWKEENPIYDGTNVVEICKSRDLGAQDVFIPLYYEVSTKRLKNDPLEYVHYGWEDQMQKKLPEGFIPLDSAEGTGFEDGNG